MSGIPCLIDADGTVASLVPIGRHKVGSGAITEEDLQRTLSACPTLVPFKEFFHSARQIISLGEEIPLAFPGGRVGYVDNLLVTDDGHLVMVEMKLWRNPEAIREVIAQVLEYGLALNGMSPAQLESALRKAAPRHRPLLPGQSLLDLASRLFGDDFDEQYFTAGLERFLRNGEMLYLVAGDGIHLSVETIAGWINARSGSPFQFGLLELHSYLTARNERLVVPRLLVKTREIARHVVVVEIGGPNAALAQVQIDEQSSRPDGGTQVARRTIRAAVDPITLETMIGQLRDGNRATPELAAFASAWIDQLLHAGFDTRHIQTEIGFGVRNEANSGEFHPLCSVSNYHGGRISLHFPWRLLGVEAMRDFRAKANTIIRCFDPTLLESKQKFSRMMTLQEVMPVQHELAALLLETRNEIRNRILNLE